LLIFNALNTSIYTVSNFRTPTIICLVLLVAVGKSIAQPSISGLLRNYNGITVANGNDFIVGRNLARTNVRIPNEHFSLYISGELLQSYTKGGDGIDLRLRETFLDLYFKNSDLRLGKQIISRGRTNGMILTDILSPYDLSEFLTQDFSDLRQGTYALVYKADVGSHQFDLIFNPIVTETILPRVDGVWDFSPEYDLPIGLIFMDSNSKNSVEDFQYAAQFKYRPSKKLNLDISAQYWEYPLPTYSKQMVLTNAGPVVELEKKFTKSLMIGYSGDYKLKDGLLATFEGTYYKNRFFDKAQGNFSSFTSLSQPELLRPETLFLLQNSFNDEANNIVSKPFAQFMGGFDKSNGSRYASIQGIIEIIPNHDQTVAQKRINTTVSLLLRDTWLDERWKAQALVRYGVSGRDYWINPEISHTPIDAITLSMGAQLFGGRASDDVYNFRLSRYSENSFIFSKLSWNW
jgi:hypothetical protein